MFGIDDAALAVMLSGAISTAANLYTNKKNRDAQAEANAINWEIARANNATQIEMANTAHQREVRDLRAAGLNPILSAGGNGSSVPTLQSPTLNPVRFDNAFEGLANSAKGLSSYFGQQYKADLAQRSANAALTSAEADLTSGEADVARVQNHLAKKEADFDLKAWNKAHGLYEVFDPKSGKTVTVMTSPNKYRMMEALRADAYETAVRDATNINWRNNLGSVTGGAVNSASALNHGVNSVRHATKLLRETR